MEDSHSQAQRSSAWWRLPLLLAVVLAAILWARGCGIEEVAKELDKDNAAPAPAADAREKVSLEIDFGDGRRKAVDAIAWRDGMTVADLLAKTPDLKVTQRGSGESAFLTTIDDVSNEGAEGRNWIYAVNGKTADRSFAIYTLKSGDRVLWTFTKQQ
jgi:hypothetical protein